MEGDSPALLHTMQNGVNGGPQDHPEWGGWGGRYRLVDLSRQSMHYADTADVVIGVDNVTYSSNQASVWRWRRAYQQEMAARVGIPVSNVRYLIKTGQLAHVYTSPGRRNPKIPLGAWERYLTNQTGGQK